MEKYSNYKDSGIQWLGNIPEHWEVRRLKDVIKVSQGLQISRSERFHKPRENSVQYNTIPSIQGKVEEHIYKPSKNVLCTKEEMLVVRTGSGVGKILTNIEGAFHNNFFKAKNNKTIASKFCYFLLASYNTQFLMRSYAGLTAIPDLNHSDFYSIFFTLPESKEQTQIANYLDTKTTAIDKKIKLLQQKTEHYKAYRKNLINEAITKGLDKTVNLKDSGIDWLGVIPKHWEVKRLKDVGKAIIGIVYSPSNIVNKDEGILVLRSSNIQNDKPSFLNNVYVNKVIPKHHLTKIGDILICSRNGSRRLIGKNIVIDNKTSGYTFGAFMTILRSKNYRFLSYFFKSILFDFQSGVFMTSTINQLTVSTLNKLYFAFPPIEEQIQIADYLDAKTSTIDKIVKNIETQIITLKELRKTLINEVVTGKVKVSA